jgi:sigma-E factor negative regulatory protein RseC
VPSTEPLVTGQKVELGIAEGSLLGSAMLVYLSPLVGLFALGGLFQVLFGTDPAAMCGAALGGVGGFLLARGFSSRLAVREEWQPVILSVGLPPDQLRVEMLSSEAR